MSSETFAFNRRRARNELDALAEEHFKHDLQPSDRDKLQLASQKIAIHATLGSLIGIGLGTYFAFRLRRGRVAMFDAFKAKEKPTAVQFADGRTGKYLFLSIGLYKPFTPRNVYMLTQLQLHRKTP